MQRLNVLISAFSCQPSVGSERGTGWDCATHLARYHDVWVLTRGSQRRAIEAELADRPIDSLCFIYLDLPDVGRIFNWENRGRSFQISYYLWQLAAYFVARRAFREIGFHVVHHVTLVKYWAPSFLALLPAPFVWGPVGGGESVPREFGRRFGLSGRIYEFLRNSARRLGEKDPFVRATARRAAASLAASPESAARMSLLGSSAVQVYPAIGVSERDLAILDQDAVGQETRRFISIGRLIHWKGFDLGLRAFAKAGLPDWKFAIVGDGAERQRLERLAKELGIAHSVEFRGALGRAETLRLLAESAVLVHPSLHESGGMVCLEAMAARKPVLCLAIGGPAVHVTHETGVPVPVRDPAQTIAELAAAMTRLAADAALRRKLGEAGRRRIETEFMWAEKARHYCALYESVISQPVP
jgi:glycosyltransferase involved in cell wall biosynthesis